MLSTGLPNTNPKDSTVNKGSDFFINSSRNIFLIVYIYNL
jgi:hypothetical protein